MDDKLHRIRHSLAHLLAAAVKERYPHAKLGIGPVIDNGFYYDFDFSGGEAPSQQEFLKLEKVMRRMISQKQAFKRFEASSEEAEKLFASEPFKLELVRELVAGGETMTAYKNGEFTDLCAGPHVEDTTEISADAFKLDRLAGAYWKGSEKNQMLTRIYGLAFLAKEELEAYVKTREEAEKRDHRKLAKELDLFMISDEVGKGLPLWLPNGAFIRRRLEDYMYDQEYSRGYKYVYTPVLTHKSLYEKSGHLAHYREDMYSPIDIEGEQYYLKPMNCPHHHMIFRNKPLSYRDLPLRLAEFGLCHRFERSGVLTGLIRARCFTQNDSHIYCAKSDLKKELLDVLKLFKDVYADFRIGDFWFRLSLPDFSNAEKYGDIKDRKMWEEASAAAREVLEDFGVKYVIGEGEASFYGPKIDVQVKNVAGKEDTIATAQVDFYSANKFDLTFTNQDGQEEKPVIIHRAVMGSFDRFFAFLTEQTGGAYPVWLAPVQARILPISDKQEDFARRIEKELKAGGVRAELVQANESLGKRIRAAKMQKIPYLIVLGEKEEADGQLTVESRAGSSEKMGLDSFLAKIRKEEEEKG